MLRLLNDQVLLKVLALPPRDDITIPDPMPCRQSCTSQDKETPLRPNLTSFGEVVAVGKGALIDAERRVTPDVRIGDQVVLREPYSASRLEILIRGVRHWIVCSHDIAAVVMSPTTT